MRQRMLDVEIVGGSAADWLLRRKVRRRRVVGQFAKTHQVQHHNGAGNTAHEKLSARFGCNLEVSIVLVIHGPHSKLIQVSHEAGSLKIATFNINNINKRLHNLTSWLAKAQPDVVCLQELKAEQRAFPASALRDLGYRGVWLGERSWNGVAILARDCDPVLTRSSLPGNPEDRQARYIEAAVNGVLITSIYLPNGNPQPGPKFDYKLAWLERLIEHGAELMKAGVPVVLAGDYNVVPTVQDIYATRSLDKNALIQPQSRRAYARLLAQGWTDALRKLQPEGPLWTFWDYERNRWALDKGMRLDHFLLSPSVRERLAL